MPHSHLIGSATIVALQDGEGTFFQPRTEAFARATAEQWRLADERDPLAVTADGQWRLAFRCFAVRLPGDRVILVDAGIGPADAPAKSWAPVPGRLPEELAAAGIAPEEVDAVVLTHLHTDHVGWAVTDGPYFPNARYLLQRAELDAIDTLNPQLRELLIEPLRASDQLQLVAGEATLADGLRVIATPGHTPGHQSILLETADRTMLITGDLLLHAVQLVEPELPYAHDEDPDAARATRVALLDELSGRPGTVLATPHLGEPFVALSSYRR